MVHLLALRGHDLVASGSEADILRALRDAGADANATGFVVIDSETGRRIDLDLRPAAEDPPRPARGRPKLGVRAREVTLLPRHWDWLAAQRGGASATLRRLIDEARRHEGTEARQARGMDAAFRFLNTLAGDLPQFEEAIRALYARDPAGMAAAMQGWPGDIAELAQAMARGDFLNDD
ncbi:DUF2239 family protein [Actibacterium sp. MT2.3-13A]|uniref:DUF2239 family protein n=1 Tax=Actibacterium sp. MT2.3-13A TaxID=2828332 RepID=UPI001BA62EE1|nr:DUF2239 family protein [Actibacterium sp. MT2.3-13A]